MPSQLALIYARSQNRCIGRAGDLPWNLPDDLRFFENTTIGCPVIMGRRTYQEGRAPLPGRLNIIVTRDSRFPVDPGVIRANSLDTAIEHASVHGSRIFVIGGATLLAEAMPLASIVFETLVHADIEGDTFLPELDFSGWRTNRLLVHEVDARHAYAFSVLRHLREPA